MNQRWGSEPRVGYLHQKKEWSYRPKTWACRHNLPLRITWGGSHMAAPLPLSIRLKMSQILLKKSFDLITCSPLF